MSAPVADRIIGQRIENVFIDNDERDGGVLTLLLEGRVEVRVWDDGQQCCEMRYMSTDDPLDYFRGASLYSMELRAGSYEEDEDGYGDVTESQFLLINTSKGTFTVVNYNAHNGYYGGFDIMVDVTLPEGES